MKERRKERKKERELNKYKMEEKEERGKKKERFKTYLETWSLGGIIKEIIEVPFPLAAYKEKNKERRRNWSTERKEKKSMWIMRSE